jgi:hypothetical protein
MGGPDDICIQAGSETEGSSCFGCLDDLLAREQGANTKMDLVSEGCLDPCNCLRGGGGTESDFESIQATIQKGLSQGLCIFGAVDGNYGNNAGGKDWCEIKG